MSEQTNISEYVPVRQLGLPRGVKLWKLDKNTLEITEVKIEAVKDAKGDLVDSVKIDSKQYRYASGINARNADRKFVKMVSI